MNILIITPNPIDTTSFYRAWGVFPFLAKEHNITLISDRGKSLTWVDIAQMDIVYMHRPFTIEQLNFAQYVKEMKIPLWVDYDDDLTSIPAWMSFYQTYMNDNTQKIIKAVIGIADIVTVSTSELKRRYADLNELIEVIPNAFNDYILGDFMPYNSKKIVMWRGSETHHVDLMNFKDDIEKCINREDWEWQYFGFNPWFLPKTKHIPVMDPVMYFRTMRSINPGVMFVPLIDDTFNRCKSNINWLEATYAGAACLVPDWEEWNHTGTFTYKDHDSFVQQLTFLMSPESALVRKTAYQQSVDEINRNFGLSKVNNARLEIINFLKK